MRRRLLANNIEDMRKHIAITNQNPTSNTVHYWSWGYSSSSSRPDWPTAYEYDKTSAIPTGQNYFDEFDGYSSFFDFYKDYTMNNYFNNSAATTYNFVNCPDGSSKLSKDGDTVIPPNVVYRGPLIKLGNYYLGDDGTVLIGEWGSGTTLCTVTVGRNVYTGQYGGTFTNNSTTYYNVSFPGFIKIKNGSRPVTQAAIMDEVNLKSQWRQSTVSYDTGYTTFESFSNYHVASGSAVMEFTPAVNMTIYFKNDSQSAYDYVTVKKGTSSVATGKSSTDWIAVNCTAGSKYTFTYSKNATTNSGADRGYVAIPNEYINVTE